MTYFFFGALAGLAIGYAIGEIVSLSTNRRAGPPLQAIAVGGVAIAFVVRLVLLLVDRRLERCTTSAQTCSD